MIGILLISHGKAAEGLLDSSRMFFPDSKAIMALSFEADESPDEFGERIRAALTQLDDGHGVIVLCDILGGTPANQAACLVEERVQVLTGASLPMLLELLGNRMNAEDIRELDIDVLTEAARSSIVSVNRWMAEMDQEEE